MKRFGWWLLLVLFVVSGCAPAELQRNTLRQASTITDLQYRLVLDNLAMLVDEPMMLPWHVKLDDGRVQVEDEVRAQADVSPLTTNLEPLIGGFGERRTTHLWGVVPVTDPKELRDLQTAYRIALDRETDEDLIEGIDEIPTGWFEKGRRDDVPRNARFVGRYRDRYVWVPDDHIEELTRFTLNILSIVRLDPDERSFDRGIIPSSDEDD